jgi:hypothetical protein
VIYPFSWRINSKSNKPKKPRNTPVQQIISAAKQGDDLISTERAMFIAKYGRPFSKEEQELLNFYIYWETLKMIQIQKRKGKNIRAFDTPEQAATWEKGIEGLVEGFGNDICKLFLKAVKEHDSDKILKISKAVWFFSDMYNPKFKHFDLERNLLLLWKYQLQQSKQKWTIRQVAEKLAHRKVETPADGFSALRRKCRQLNFPLAESRKISKK